MGRQRRALGLLGAAVLSLAVSACGGDDGGSAATSTTGAPPDATAATTPPGTAAGSEPTGATTGATTGTTGTSATGGTGGTGGDDPCADVPAPQPLAERQHVTIAMPVKVQNFDHALLADALGEFDAENIDAEISIAQTPDIVTLLAQSRVDVGAIGLNVGILNAIAEGVDIHWVSGFTQVRDSDLGGVYVRSDWVEDPASFDVSRLEGAKVGIGVGGRSTQQLLDIQRVLDEGGLSIDDVTLVELSSSDFGAAMKSHAVDALSASNVQQIIDEGTGVKIAGLAPITAGGYFFDKELVGDRRDVGLAVMRALLRTQCEHLQGDYYDDPAVLDALVTVLEIPEESVRSQPPLLFDLRIADGSFEALQDAWTAQGDLVQYDQPLAPEQVIDTSIYDEVTGG